ncbi:MAG: hypothetical protein JSR46_00160 [Verrucomicrobia bacterium]|nr:hypothetical protein [Verrucomicrobiota bacterium]
MHDNQKRLQQRVFQASEEALLQQNYVSPIDVFLGMKLLKPEQVLDWKKGKIPYLERVILGNLNKISFYMKCFRAWAKEKGLKPKFTGYISKSKQELRFSKSGHPQIEQSYRTHYISPILFEIKEQKIQDKLHNPPEQVVIQTTIDSQCTACEKKLPVKSYLFTEGGKALCLPCANLQTWAFLSSINRRLARFLKRENAKFIPVKKFTRSDKRYQRQGILLDRETLKKAYQELSGEDFEEETDFWKDPTKVVEIRREGL